MDCSLITSERLFNATWHHEAESEEFRTKMGLLWLYLIGRWSSTKGIVMSLERQQNQQDDHALGERVEKFVWTQTHEVRTTNPPWWKVWESPKTDEVLIQRIPTASWLFSQFVGTLPASKQSVAYQPDVKERLVRRIEAELKRYDTKPR